MTRNHFHEMVVAIAVALGLCLADLSQLGTSESVKCF